MSATQPGPKVMSRNKSVMTIQSPSDAVTHSNTTAHGGLRVENINDAVLIEEVELQKIIKRLNSVEGNEEKLGILEETKTPYLFQSEQLSKILEVTTSVRTKINMMAIIGPRLTDPKAKTSYFIGLFRYAEEKSQVEEILKARTQTLNSSVFNKGEVGGRRVGGGRGHAGRGPAGGGRGPSRATLSSVSVVDGEHHNESGGHLSPSPSTDAYDTTGGDRTSCLASGTDEVFADIDKIGNEGRHVRGLDVEDEPFKRTHLLDHMDVAPTTDTEMSSVSSEEDHRPKSVMDVKPWGSLGSGSNDKETYSSAAFSAPTKINNSMNPLKQKAQEKAQNSNKEGERRITSLRLLVSSQSNSWQAQQKEDPSKCIQAGSVLAKVNNFTQSQPIAPSISHSKSGASTPRNSLGATGRKFSLEHSLSVNNIVTAIKKEEKIPGRLPLSTLTSAAVRHRDPSPAAGVTSSAKSMPQSPNVNCDLASKCATVLKMTREEFLALGSEESKGVSAEAKDVYSYRELVRRNFVKDYTGLVQLELERHLDKSEFLDVFEKNESQFYSQAKWKQLDQKKKALLF